MPKSEAPRLIWITDVIVSDPITEKIRDKHGLDAQRIIALIKSPPFRIGRNSTDHRGRRLLLKIRMRGKGTVLVVLRPISDDRWRLVSAYVITRRGRA